MKRDITNNSDWELLAILLGKSDIAHRLLEEFGNFRFLATATVAELTEIPGVGPATALRIQACTEIAKRLVAQSLDYGTELRGSKEVFDHFHSRLRDERKEYFYALHMDNKNRVIREDLVSIGSLSTSIVHPREVFKPAIRESATGIILAHNHPSGDPTPSVDDISTTKRLKKVGLVVGIDVMDHIIIGDGTYVSFVEQHLL